MVKKKILVAMSGGVDSTLTAILLKKKGYEVLGFNFLQTENESHLPKLQEVCKKYNIPLIIKDIRTEFQEKVIYSFVKSYQEGNTPSPCPHCNKEIKWAQLLKTADEHNIDFVATGHYAKIGKYKERYYIASPKDSYKSQTYFLWYLGQKELARTVFPLGEMLKEEVKQKMKDFGLENFVEQSESFGLCFMQQVKLPEFLNSYDVKETMGDVVSDNIVIGPHKGIQFYTIGQKIRINEKNYYVNKKDVERQILYVGDKGKLFQTEFFVNQLNSTKYALFEDFPAYIEIIINGKASPVKAKISKWKGDIFQVKLESPLYAPASGQEVAIYEDYDLIGGAVIV